MHDKDWGSGSPLPHTYCRWVAQHTGVSGAQTARSLCCASAAGWHCPHPRCCLPTQLWLCPRVSTCPQPAQRASGVMDVMEENTRNGFFPSGQTRKCHTWTCTAARLGKGQGMGRREAVGR